MTSAPIILVPGFWLGAWAWDEVVEALRTDGHEVAALTLPGLESVEADRSTTGLSDHVEAIGNAVRAASRPVVLAVHSAAGYAGYVVTDRMPERIAAMVYVDTAPGIGAMDPSFEGLEMPLPSPERLESDENLDGLSAEQLETFRRRAVPEPGGVLRDAIQLRDDARRDVPSTIVCTSFSSEAYQAYARDQDPGWLRGLAELRHITWVDLPTSHWPMWSRPRELAGIIGDVAKSPTGPTP